MRIKNIESLLWQGYEIPETLKAEIALLFNMTVNELRAKFYYTLGFCTHSRNKDFLIRKIAWKMQAKMFEDEAEGLKTKAYEIADFSRLRVRDTIMPRVTPIGKIPLAKPFNSGRDKRLPMYGAFISKNYRGKKILVKVLENSFEYEGREYSSLSNIAREITGTNWNGYKFFNL